MSSARPASQHRGRPAPAGRPSRSRRHRAGGLQLFDDAPVAYALADHQGVIRALNAEAGRLLDVNPTHANGLPLRSWVAQPDRAALSSHLARVVSDGRAGCELLVQPPHGKAIHVRLETRRTRDPDNLVWVALFDISVQKRAESEHARLEEAERTARNVNAAKDRFIAALSHELRAPLAPVLAAISGLENDPRSGERFARSFEIIRRNVLREARLIDDLLDVSRIASGKVSLHREITDIHAVAREAVEMLSAEAAARGLSVRVDLAAGRHRLDADPARLRQALTNLVKNALKFTPSGGHVTLRSWNNGDAVIVEVSDDGIGIEQQNIGRIFESFEQVRPASPGEGGLGLGLAIARGMIELHGGKIAAHSAGPGRGARFLVELVALPAEAAGEAPPRPADKLPPRRAPRTQSGHILLIEDEPDLAEALSSVLASQGYRVKLAATAGVALATDLGDVRVIISDIGLPDLDGRLLLPALRSKRRLPAIALSGYGTEADVQASRAAGFDQHLTKPVEMDVLLAAVNRACSRARTPAPVGYGPTPHFPPCAARLR